MILQVGKSYRNRMGDVVKITSRTNNSMYPFISDDNNTYTNTGRRIITCRTLLDLIEEVHPKRRKAKWKIRGRVKPEKVRVKVNHFFTANTDWHGMAGMQIPKTHGATYPDTPEHLGPEPPKGIEGEVINMGTMFINNEQLTGVFVLCSPEAFRKQSQNMLYKAVEVRLIQ